MEGLTNKAKYFVAGLALLTLPYLPLNAQKYESDWLEKNNMAYCIRKNAIKLKKDIKTEKLERYCISDAAKKNKREYLKREKKDNYCVGNQEKRYSKHAPEVNTKKRR